MKAPIKTLVTFSVSALFSLGMTACSEPTARVGKTVTSGTADIGGDYTLINQDGVTVTQADALGKPHMVYFGFSYCPDKVYSQKVPLEDSAADYTVDHSDIMYLMDKDGEFVEFFFGKSTVPEMAARVNLHLKNGT